MGIYWEFVKKSFQARFIYRVNSYFQVAGSIIKLFVLISAWTALYHGKAQINGITLSDMISFVTINLVVAAVTYSHMGEKIANRVNDGSIAMDFMKPINFKLYMIADDLGENLYRAAFTTIPACAFAALFWGFRFPDSPLRMAMFLVSLTNGLIIIMYINYIFGLAAFWFKSAIFVEWFLGALLELFSGTFVPLWFYPQLLLKMSMVLPFRYISFEPIAIFLGRTPMVNWFSVIATQWGWIVAIWVIDRIAWRMVQSRVTVHGG